MDKFGFTPDGGGGSFVDRDGKRYMKDGSVITLGPNTMMRAMPSSLPAGDENYADWSDEKRAEVWTESEKRYRAQDDEVTNRESTTKALAEQAKAKLTEAEYKAIFNCGYHEGRGFW